MKIFILVVICLFVGIFASSGGGSGSGSGGHHKEPSQMNSTEFEAWCKDLSHNTIYNLGSKLQCPEVTQKKKF
jgi:hypothetical protein